MSEFQGTPGPDTLVGTGGDDTFWLQSGGDDNASGGEGSDGFYFGTAYTSSDVVDGGGGADSVALQGDYAALTLGALSKVEVLLLASGSDTRFGASGASRHDYNLTSTDANVATGAILTLIAGDLLADEDLAFNGAAESDGNFRVFAGRGTDTLTGGAGSDGFFFGADGNLTGADRIDGGAGIDSIALRGDYSGSRAVRFGEQSFTGIEVIVLLSGHSNEYGGAITPGGFDYDLTFADANIASWQVLDVIGGNLRANETMRIDGSAETGWSGLRVIAGAGDDVLIGGGGGDRFYGGLGADTLTGGGERDVFGFNSVLGAGNVDTITDFETRLDRIELSGSIFGALAAGQLHANWLGFGAEASESTHRIVFDAATGALLYDADGAGGAAGVQFATIQFKSVPDGGYDSPFFSAENFIVTGAANRAPIITSGNSTTVAENIDPSTIVFDVAATDPDGDAVGYYLFGPDAAAATIDRATGEIRFKAAPDFETQSEYRFEVGVADSSGQYSYQSIGIRITDVLETAGATPVLAETSADNQSFGGAQAIARQSLAIAANGDLADDNIRSIRIEGAIASASDRDFFKISLKKGELLILDVDHSGGNLDAIVHLQGIRGWTIADDDPGFDDAGSEPHPTYGHNTDPFLRFRVVEDGEYYFWIESFQDPQQQTFGSYQLNVSIGPVATEAEIWEEDVAAMLSGNSWASNALSYAFPGSAADYPAGIDETDEPGEFAQFGALQQAATTQLLSQISAVSGLGFQLLAGTPGAADLKFAMSDEAEVAYAYYPNLSELGGTAWFNKEDFNDPVKGGYAWMGILHETGHTLGLKHGQDWPNLSFDHDSLEYTVMTYRSFAGAPLQDLPFYLNETWGFPQSLMILDIAALQRLYGANYDTNAGDSVYSWSPATYEMFINGVGQGAPGGPRLFLTIWDGGGVDTYDFSSVGGSGLIDLRPGQYSTVFGDRGSALLSDSGQRARGDVYNALLHDGDTRSLIENAIGGPNNNGFVGNQAKNQFIGGGGMDSYTWFSVDDIGLGDTADEIMDWRWGPSRINLSQVDADSSSWMDDAFTFIGLNAFSGKAGELRYALTGDGFKLFGDTNGDALADFELIVHKFDPLESLALDFQLVL